MRATEVVEARRHHLQRGHNSRGEGEFDCYRGTSPIRNILPSQDPAEVKQIARRPHRDRTSQGCLALLARGTSSSFSLTRRRTPLRPYRKPLTRAHERASRAAESESRAAPHHTHAPTRWNHSRARRTNQRPPLGRNAPLEDPTPRLCLGSCSRALDRQLTAEIF